MKKLIYSIIGLLMFAGCEDDYKTDITIPLTSSLKKPQYYNWLINNIL